MADASTTGTDPPQALPSGPSVWQMGLGRLRAGWRRAVYWRKAHPRLALGIAAGLACLAAAHVTLFMVMGPSDDAGAVTADQPTLDNALAALDAGRPREARRIAERVESAHRVGDSELGVYAYILGAAAHRDAVRAKPPLDRRKHLFAAKYLEQAIEVGVPDERRAGAMMMLGQSQIASGQYAQARDVLLRVLPQLVGDQATEAHRLLHAVCTRRRPPNHAEALRHIDAYLAASPRPEQRQAAWLDRAATLVRLGRTEEAKQELAKLPAKSELRSDAYLLRGRAALVEGDRAATAQSKAEAKASPQPPAAASYEQAGQFFRDAQAADPTDSRVVRQAMYLIGVSLSKLQQWREAAAQFDRTEKQFYETAEGFAACVGQAEAFRQLKEDEPAIGALKRAAASPGRDITDDEVWITGDALRRLIVQWHGDYTTDGNLSAAAAVADVLAKAGDVGRSLELLAETHGQRIRLHQRALAQPAAPAKVEEMQVELRRETLLAAEVWSRLANERFSTPNYTECVARAAELFLRSCDFDRAIQLWKEYLRYETGSNVPTALVSMAEAELSRGRVERAISLARDCLESHLQSPLAYRARLLISRAHEERGELSQALAALEENLNSQLTPASPEWREAKFESGRLLYLQASRLESESRRLEATGPSGAVEAGKQLDAAVILYRDAIGRLDEAIQRYPQSPQVITTRHMLAAAHRGLARGPQRKLQAITIQQQRAALNKEIQAILTTSLEHFQRLQDDLNRKQERHPLSVAEATILRNCYFALGSLHFDMGQYDQAITAYRAAANAYQNHPEAVSAYFQIAACQRRRPGAAHEARGTLEQGKVVLGRMSASDAEFVATTMHTKQEWERMFDWLMQM